MPVRCILLAVILIWLLGPPGAAAADEAETKQPPKSDQELPSDDLLEFLGQWETEKGKWVDPGDLDWLMQPGSGQSDDE